ncbi:hypothetical protein HK101_011901 [Irineochytrium annulatum]|nr:hypothetical protein HK101_011901 [Irineochytrium annulatum]
MPLLGQSMFAVTKILIHPIVDAVAITTVLTTTSALCWRFIPSLNPVTFLFGVFMPVHFLCVMLTTVNYEEEVAKNLRRSLLLFLSLFVVVNFTVCVAMPAIYIVTFQTYKNLNTNTVDVTTLYSILINFAFELADAAQISLAIFRSPSDLVFYVCYVGRMLLVILERWVMVLVFKSKLARDAGTIDVEGTEKDAAAAAALTSEVVLKKPTAPSDANASTDEPPPFTPMPPHIRFGYTRFTVTVGQTVGRLVAVTLTLLFVSLPASSLWMHEYGYVSPAQLLIRAGVAFTGLAILEVVLMRCEERWVGFDRGEVMREVREAGMSWKAIAFTCLNTASILGTYLMADTGLIFDLDTYIQGRRPY